MPTEKKDRIDSLLEQTGKIHVLAARTDERLTGHLGNHERWRNSQRWLITTGIGVVGIVIGIIWAT